MSGTVSDGPSPMPPSSRAQWLARGVLGGLIALGAWLRLPTLPAPALWNDEAWRAVVIENGPTLPSLLGYARATGGWMLLGDWGLGRVGLAVFGEDPLAFRIWPLLFGVLALPLAYSVVRRLSGVGAGLCAAALLALGPGFILHAREFKPFALDLCLTLAAVRLALENGAAHRLRSDIALSGTLIVFACSSLVFPFVYPAIVLHRVWIGRRRQVADLALLAVPGIVFSAYYALFLLPQSTSTAQVQRLWQQRFPDSLENLLQLLGSLPEALDRFVLVGWVVALLAAAVWTPFASRLRRDGFGTLVWLPLAVQTGFASQGVYPLFGRASTYWYGLVALAVAYAGGDIHARLRGRLDRRGRLALAAAVLTCFAGIAATASIRDPYPVPTRPRRALVESIAHASEWPPDMGRRAMETLEANRLPGEVVLMGSHMAYPFTFHRRELLPSIPELQGLSLVEVVSDLTLRDATSETLCRGAARLWPRWNPKGTLWLLASMSFRPDAYEDVFSRLGTVEFLVRERNQALARVELDAAAAGPPPCLSAPELGSFELHSAGAARRRIPVERFPAVFQLRAGLVSETPAGEFEIDLRLLTGEPGRELRSVLGRRRDPSAPHRFLVNERDWERLGGARFADVRAIEFELRAPPGRNVRVRVENPRVD